VPGSTPDSGVSACGTSGGACWVRRASYCV
jgi:hypothetical protein